MLTPQAIKDQEFQIKFRGYDAIEVKAYLELLAEDFFEVTEQSRVQAEEIEALRAEQESLVREKETLIAEVKASQDNADGIQSDIEEGYKHKDLEIEELKEKLAVAEQKAEELQKENEIQTVKIEELEEQLTGDLGLGQQDQAELDKLRARVAVLEETNNELKKEGVDFKTTILAAQKFADSLRATSEAEAAQLLENARLEVEKFKADAEAQLSQLPKEINELKEKKGRVKEELKNSLLAYLNALDEFPDELVDPDGDDLSDLFESIEIPDTDEDKF
ncbi:DivIVA domain-containing protein [Desulforhopalus sp. IMCC35007]|uniref:DivIVA domain-containing protein n=1 Tax=Desulforhopalus sp. IMCC35007 TaxID=2569543 RepID=UPI0010ADAA97|nr:DivIVA domain-containing protein [Desulforhopalus sp. IMCC35007]TKB12148.1 DivIVA domain-containing protein [Desulforhopalus sp. IMCC35007]